MENQESGIVSTEPTRSVVVRGVTVTLKPGDVWGYTQKAFKLKRITDKDRPPCIFRDGRRLCPAKGGTHGYLFVTRKEFDPAISPGCPDCLEILRDEQIDEEAKKHTSSQTP
jgi:hypothetical protein